MQVVERLHNGLRMIHGDISRKNVLFSHQHGGAVLIDFANAIFEHEVYGPWGTHLSDANESGGRISWEDDMYAGRNSRGGTFCGCRSFPFNPLQGGHH